MLMTDDNRTFRGFRLRDDTRKKLADLADRYKAEAPAHVKVSQRVVIEVLIDYAARNDLSFSDLLGILEAK